MSPNKLIEYLSNNIVNIIKKSMPITKNIGKVSIPIILLNVNLIINIAIVTTKQTPKVRHKGR